MNTLTVNSVTIGEGMPKICVPIVATNETMLLEQLRDFDRPDIDLLEWRIDYMDCLEQTPQLISIAKKIKEQLPSKPLLVTFRSKKEGGEATLSQTAYCSLLQTFSDEKAADLLDVELYSIEEQELTRLIQSLHKADTKLILSNHDFNQTPEKEEILRRLQKMQELGADIAKIAVMPQCPEDVLTLLQATSEMTAHHANIPIVTMSMGSLGKISRISGACFGSAITFGSLQAASAPGQIPADTLRTILQCME